MAGVLDRILAAKQSEMAALRAQSLPAPPPLVPADLRRAPAGTGPLKLIAEIKRRSPSAGPLSTVLDVPERLARLILALMEKRPQDRPASALEVAEALKAVHAELGR